MKFIKLVLIICLTIYFALPTVAAEEKSIIRVGISNSSFSTFEFKTAKFLTTNTTSVTAMDTGLQATDMDGSSEVCVEMINGLFNAYIDGEKVLDSVKGPVVIASNGKIGVKDLNRKGNPAFYNGMIELKSSKNGFNIINVLDLQSYVKGVVPNEMPVSFGLEALKAQAIAARNYANRPQNGYSNYDICDSTACQVYYGVNGQTAISDKAVDETLGMYALYKNEPIVTLYSSTGGGITENYNLAFGSGVASSDDKPYLKSVIDSNSVQKLKTEEDIKKYYSTSVPSFDMKSPRYRWKVNFDRFELESVLAKTLLEQSKAGLVTPQFLATNEFYGLEDIKVLKRGESGKALEIEIKAATGVWHVKKELGIRRVLKKNNAMLSSGNFYVEKAYDAILKDAEINAPKVVMKEKIEPETIVKKVADAVFSFSTSEDQPQPVISAPDESQCAPKKVYCNAKGEPLPSSFTFTGGGFGHGVGMSQYGAGFMSSYGVGYDAILKHYYSGITLGTMKKTVSYNNYNQDYVSSFYYNAKNVSNSAEVLAKINQSPLKMELTDALNVSVAPKKAILNIDNSKRPSGSVFYVNSYRFELSPANYGGKILKMDITKYLLNGINTITFSPLKPIDKDKSTTFWVEMVQ